jgi:hypothetical protein
MRDILPCAWQGEVVSASRTSSVACAAIARGEVAYLNPFDAD